MRFISKNRVGLIIIQISLIGLFLVGCGGQRPIQSDDRIELEFWTLQLMGFSDYIEGMIADYEAAHPNVRIKWVDVPFSEGEKKALTSMLANNTPDVINLNPDFSAILASRGALLNLNQWVPDADRNDYLPVAWQASSIGDHAFGIPWYITSSVTLYNQALLKKASLLASPEDKIELVLLADRLKERDLGYVCQPDIGNKGRFFRYLVKSDIPLWNEQHDAFVFADHGADRELAYWTQLYQQGLIPKESLTEGQQAAIDRYQSGTLGLLFTGPNRLNMIEENAPDVFRHTHVAPQFPRTSDAVDFAVMVLVVPQRTPHPKEATEFALYVTNTQNSLALAQLAPVLPSRQTALKSDFFQQYDARNVKEKARWMSAQQLLAAKKAMPVHPLQSQFNQLMDYYVQSALLGKLSPTEAMIRAQHEMNNLLK